MDRDRDEMDRDRVHDTVRDDLPEPMQQHLDEQSATGLPEDGPGSSKAENLRRMRRQVEVQRERLEDADPSLRHASEQAPEGEPRDEEPSEGEPSQGESPEGER